MRKSSESWEKEPFFRFDKIVKTHYAFWERILPRARFWNRSEKHYLTKNKIFGFWREIICWEKQFLNLKKMGNCCKCLQKDDDEERLIGDDSDSGLLLFFKWACFGICLHENLFSTLEKISIYPKNISLAWFLYILVWQILLPVCLS